MKNLILALALACASLVITPRAEGQAVRFVSATGVDSNPCTRTQPCRSMQRGVDVTPSGGMVEVVDSAGYGPNVVITQPITITARGISATIITPNGVGILVNAPGAAVVIRGLTINGVGTGLNGIAASAVGSLHIEDCAIGRFTNDGILFSADGELFIRDVLSRNHGNNGLEVAPAAGTARVTVSRSRFEANARDGVDFASGTIEAAVTETVAAGNTLNGFAAGGAAEAGVLVRVHIDRSSAAQNTLNGFVSFATAEMTIERSEGRGNLGSGMATGATGAMTVSNSVATDNATGFTSAGGTFQSRQNNTVRGNTVNTSGTITPLPAV